MEQCLLLALRKRDAREVEAFDVVIRAYSTILATSRANKQNLEQERLKTAALEQTKDALTHEVQKLSDEGGQVVDSAKMGLLEDQVAELLKVRGDLYQQQASQSNRMLEMTAAVDDAEEATQRYKLQSDKLQEEIEEKKAQIVSLNATIDEINLQSATWQQKSMQTSKLLDELRKKHEELRQLHEELSVQWVKKSEELAVQQNEMNAAKKELTDDIRAFQVLEMLRKDARGGAAGEVNLTAGMDDAFFSASSLATLPTTVKTVMKAHGKDCYGVAFNNNTGAHFATCAGDKDMKVWQVMGLREGGESHSVRQPQAVLSVSFSSDDTMLITGGADNSVRMYSANQGKEKRLYAGHRDKVFNAKCFPDCQNLVSVSHDRSVKYWDLQSSGRCLHTFLTTSMINDCAVPRDGMLVATAHYDGSVRWFDPRTKSEIEKMDVHNNHVSSIGYLPDSTKLISMSRDNSLKMIDVRMYGELFKMTSPEFAYSSSNNKCSVSPNSKYVAAGGQNGSVVIWDLATSEVASVLKTKDSISQIHCCSWSPNGQELAVSDRSGVVIIWSC